MKEKAPAPKPLVRLIATFILGILWGATLTVPLVGRELEQLAVEKEQLELKTREQANTIKELEKNLRSQSWLSVREVQVLVNYPDSVLRLQVEKTLAPLLEPYIGRDARDLDPVSLFHLFDQRVITIEGSKYLVKARAVLVSNRVTAYIVPVPVPNEEVLE